ncbi:MAG TPA: FUSC family protein [Xanthobacteraceae bacterium]|jgi:uncharacterized membrane protein YccC|nr:FUSC family protein [Xanthobacteraceae bacterium]
MSQRVGDGAKGAGGAMRLKLERLSTWDVAYAVDMALACLITYWIMAEVFSRFGHGAFSDLVGGLWAIVATVYVFRDTRAKSLSATIGRMIATGVSFALCLLCLLLFPFTPTGLATLLTCGTLIMMVLGRREEIGLTAVTTAVVMLVAAIDPHDAWRQPLLRLMNFDRGRRRRFMQMDRLVFIFSDYRRRGAIAASID